MWPKESMSQSLPVLSFALPVFNEANGLEEFYNQLTTALKPLANKYRFEFVFVNDGSRDQSLTMLTSLQARDDRIKVLDFSRNFGHQAAITAGIDEATGEAVVVMDTDLQDSPAVVLELISAWESGADVAYAQRISRQDPWLKKLTARVYYRLMARLSDVEIPQNVGDFRLIDRKVVEVLEQCRETNRYVRGLISFAGFKQVAVPFHRSERFAGTSGYSVAKMLKLASDGLTSFSDAPLQLATYLGLGAAALAFLGIVYVLCMRIFDASATVPGWTLLMIVILVPSSLQMILLGLMGQYIGRIYSEVRRRPLYIIKDKIGKFSK